MIGLEPSMECRWSTEKQEAPTVPHATHAWLKAMDDFNDKPHKALKSGTQNKPPPMPVLLASAATWSGAESE